MLFKDFFFSLENIFFSFYQKKKIIKSIKSILIILYKFFILEKILYNFFYKKDLDKFAKKNGELFTKDLAYLFKYFSSYKQEHDYTDFYHQNFKDIKNKYLDILEIGIAKGDGLASFYFYFPNSNLIGLDNNPFRTRYKSKRIRNIYVDISSEKILKNLSNHLNKKFDIIIEDCSHKLIDQIICFKENFKNLKNGGIYIVEDLSFPRIHSMYNPTSEKVDLKIILEKIQQGENIVSKYLNDHDIQYIQNNIENIRFYKGLLENSEIVFVKSMAAGCTEFNSSKSNFKFRSKLTLPSGSK